MRSGGQDERVVFECETNRVYTRSGKRSIGKYTNACVHLCILHASVAKISLCKAVDVTGVGVFPSYRDLAAHFH